MTPVETLYASLETRDDPATWLVLADALLDAGDVRGEIIHLCLRSDSQSRNQLDALLRQHAEHLAGFAPPDGVRLDWHMGHVRSAEVAPIELEPRLAAMRGLLSHPGNRRLQSLTLLGPKKELSRNVFRDLFAGLAEQKLVAGPSLSSLQLGAGLRENPGYWVYGYFNECRLYDDLGGLWPLFPRLRTLRLDLGASELELGAIDAPELRDFEWVAPFLSVQHLSPLAQARWPELQRLVVWTGSQIIVNTEDDLYVGDDDEVGDPYVVDESITDAASLEPLLERADSLVALQTLGVVNWTGSWLALVELLRGRALWSRLQGLEMGYGQVDDVDAERLAAVLKTAPALRRVNVEQLRISPEALDQLEQQLPSVTFEGTANLSPGYQRFCYVITQE